MLVILVLLACMVTLMDSNSRTLAMLKQEIKLLDERQKARVGANHPTNQVILHGQGPGH